MPKIKTMTKTEYNREVKKIDAWAKAEYAKKELSEHVIERRVERMMDSLDIRFLATNGNL